MNPIDRDQMRDLFRQFSAYHVQHSGWSREDVREAGQSVADALSSGDAERIHDAWTWLRVGVERINGVVRRPEQEVTAEVAPAKARVPELKRKPA